MENVSLPKDQYMTEARIEQSGFSRRALLSGTAAIGAGLVLAEGATSPTHAASFEKKLGWLMEESRMGTVSVKDYGATGDGVTDDTVAIQAAIDAVLDFDNEVSQAVLVVPSGVYSVNASLTIAGVRGFIFSGSGINGTKFIWDGNDDTDNLFELTDLEACTFENFTVQTSQDAGTPRLNAVFRSRNNTASLPVNTGNILRNLLFEGTNGGFEYGVFWDDTGASDTNNDLYQLENVRVANPNKYGFYINHTQSKQHSFMGCSVSNGVNGVRFTGGVKWYAGSMSGQSGACFFISGIADTLLVSGADFEGCDRLLDTDGNGTYAFPVTFQAIRFHTGSLNSDANVIDFGYPGPLVVIGCYFDGNNPVIIKHRPIGSVGCHDVILGNHFNVELASDANPFDFHKTFNGSGDENEALVSGNTFLSSDGSVQQRGIFTDGDLTPIVTGKRRWKTANTTAKTITMFDGAYTDQEIVVIFGDSNTTIDFTGTNLKGNAGVDWSPATDDHMTCVFDGTDWFCSVSDNTA